MQAVNINQRFTKNSQILCKEMDGEAVLIDPYRQELLRLNPTASEIWKLLDEEKSPAEVIGILKETFDADEDVIRKDTLDFMKQLFAREMIG